MLTICLVMVEGFVRMMKNMMNPNGERSYNGVVLKEKEPFSTKQWRELMNSEEDTQFLSTLVFRLKRELYEDWFKTDMAACLYVCCLGKEDPLSEEFDEQISNIKTLQGIMKNTLKYLKTPKSEEILSFFEQIIAFIQQGYFAEAEKLILDLGVIKEWYKEDVLISDEIIEKLREIKDFPDNEKCECLKSFFAKAGMIEEDFAFEEKMRKTFEYFGYTPNSHNCEHFKGIYSDSVAALIDRDSGVKKIF